MSKTIINKRSKIIWDNGFAPDGQSLPATTSADSGKVLGVDSNGDYALKEDAGAVLPEITAQDEGKVLKVTSGDLAWENDNSTSYTAGDNISIDNGVISATDTTYTAGSNIQISAENVISATDTTYSDATTEAAGLMSAADKTKLNGIETGAEVNVNADWNAVSGDAQILNKPTLAAVATSGDYTDLTNTPTIPSYSAGANVQINDGVISATDTTYTAGTNVQINNGVISATDTTYTAGSGIAISAQNVISATGGAQDPDIEVIKDNIAKSIDDYASIDNFVEAQTGEIVYNVTTLDECVAYKISYSGANACFAVFVSTSSTNSQGSAPQGTVVSNAYACIVGNQIAIFAPDASSGEYIGYNNALYFSDLSGPAMGGALTYKELDTAYTGTNNSGYYTLIDFTDLASGDIGSEHTGITFSSISDAIAAFGAIDFDAFPQEGDYAWDDSATPKGVYKYTSGAWVKADPIVDLIPTSGGGSESYSTTERQVGTWIDGSALYRQDYIDDSTTATGTTATTITVKTFATNEVKEIVKLEGYYQMYGTSNPTSLRLIGVDASNTNLTARGINAISSFDQWSIKYSQTAGTTIRYIITALYTKN